MKKRLLLALILLLTLGLVLAGLVLHHKMTHVTLGDTRYPLSLEELDLSGAPVPYVRELPALKALKKLDLRGTGLTEEDYIYLKGQLPDCRILWLVPMGDDFYPEDTRLLTLSELDWADLELLAYFPELEVLDGRQCPDLFPLLQAAELYPELRVLYRVDLEGQEYDWDTRELTLEGADLAALAKALPLLPQLEIITLTAPQRDPRALTQFLEAAGTLPVRYTVCPGEEAIPMDTRELTLRTDPAQLLPWLSLLPQLEKVSFTDPQEDLPSLTALAGALPEGGLSCVLRLFGREIPPDTRQLDLSRIPMEDTAALEAAVALLPELTTVDMVGCGIGDEEMAALNARWPDTQFIWAVDFGKFSLRTDITYFMPYQYRYVVSDKDADKLKYLTELICLDFGHMDISRTDYLAYMPKLQFLLMCDTPITDLSVLEGHQNLRYVELFMTQVTDFSPLISCPNLVDLNVCYTYPTDPLIFAQMPQLENLWFRGMFDEHVIAALRRALPDTRIIFRQGSSTGAGWRELPNYYAQRDLMGMGYMEG